MSKTKELFIGMQDELINTFNAYENGDINVLDAVIYLREQKAFHEEMLKNIKDFESENQHEIELEANANQNEYKGAKFEFRAGRKTFDYSKIEEVATAKNNVKELEQKYKSAWENHQKGLVPVDAETGEILQLPEMKVGKSTMVVKMPKD